VDVLPIGVFLACEFGLDTECVSSEVVTLGLQQVRRQILGAVPVVEAQGRAESRRWDTPKSSFADNVSPAWLRLVDGLVEEVVEQQILELGFVAVCACDVLEEDGPNDAATTPHQCYRGLVQLPVVCCCSLVCYQSVRRIKL